MSNSRDSGHTLPPAAGERDGLAIAGVAALVIILVSSTIGWGIWTACRTTKVSSTARKTRIHQRVTPNHADTFVSEMSTLEMGYSFLKSDSCNEWHPVRLPYIRSQNSDLSTHLPTLPERAYVSGWVPFPSTLPRCQTLDAVRSPMVIAHSASDLCGVEVVLGTPSNPSHRKTGAQIPLSPPTNLLNLDEEDHEQPVVLPAPCAALGLSLCDIEGVKDDLTVKIGGKQHKPLQAGSSLDSGNKQSNHVSLDPVPTPPQLPTPPVTPILPTLVLTSAPFKRSPHVKSEQTNDASQLASPPLTPTLVLTTPSVHYGLSLSSEETIYRDLDDEFESWSDILGFHEYEDDDDLLDRAYCGLLDDFPTPPELPAQCHILNIPRLASTKHNGSPEPSVSGGGATTPQATDDKFVTHEVEGKLREASFDYAAFHKRLEVFLKDVEDQKKEGSTHTVQYTDRNASVTTHDLPTASSSTHFDYERLRSRKRSQTLLNNNTAPSSRDAPLRVGPRPLPLPAEFQPLLCRAVDRSRRQVPP